MIQKVDAVTVEEACAKAGGWGRFQTFLLILIVLSMWSGGLIEYNIAFLELDPTLNCYLKANPSVARLVPRKMFALATPCYLGQLTPAVIPP